MNNCYTSIESNDGFGAQYQRIIQTYIYCKIHNLNFVYTPLTIVAHNYDNDTTYNEKLENLMNLKTNISNKDPTMNIEHLDFGSIIMKYVESNIDLCCDTVHMKFIKECFWKNKDRDFFKNGKMNVAIHIRRENAHDKGEAGERVTSPNSYYLNIMNKIRKNYHNIQFHLYSQGEVSQFEDLINDDVDFHLNADIIDSFIGMVAANILVISSSSLSYVAALVSDGIVYYKPFWHNPKKEWIV